MEESFSKKQRQPTANLTEDLLIKILSRVPYKSLCRFKCVSRSWLALCSDPDILKKAPQTLSGFFYRHFRMPTFNSYHVRHYFTNVSRRGRPMVDPYLSFLFVSTYVRVEFIDGCNGLLLCLCTKNPSWDEIDYVMCNPATAEWTVLPETEGMHRLCKIHLCFNPAMSLHFVVFLLFLDEFAEVEELLEDVAIYASETGKWTYKQSGWDGKNIVVGRSSAFYNGALHLTAFDSSVIMVDMEGKKWRKIATPCDFSFIGMSVGHLYAVEQNDYQLSIWVLKDYDGEQWDLKHTVNALEFFETHQLSFSDSYAPRVIAIHLECSLIFLIIGKQRNLISYNMDSRKLHDICSLGGYSMDPYKPYIPCFSKWLTGYHHMGTKNLSISYPHLLFEHLKLVPFLSDGL